MMLNFDEFEGTFCDLTDPGYYAIEKNETEIIKIPRLEVIDRVLQCDFEILDSGFSNEDITDLVFIVLLKGFCQDYYLEKADFVKLQNQKTGENWQLANIS
ncbi:hypothetical protein [Shewanella algae]|uniref:hypothetical protein n=1 Tax=Shewanella algae TaxID=38313 RepID=UPI001F2448D0|nr:hypothetical protein [Shewanella algae]MCE9785679.1 hypothetical protein [Shewanella algae]